MAGFFSSPSSRIVCLATLVMAGILFSGKQAVVTACKGDTNGLVNQCKPFVLKGGSQRVPSRSCCDVVKKITDFRCLCDLIPFMVKLTISKEKVAYVARHCGNPLPYGFECGS